MSDAYAGLLILTLVVLVFPALSFIVTPLGALAVGVGLLILASE